MHTYEEIETYLYEKHGNMIEKSAKFYFGDTTRVLAFKIALFAHEGQYRENGEPYVSHPIRCFNNYTRCLGYNEQNKAKLSSEDVLLIKLFQIPFEGVAEVILLHDVVEDTDFTFEDIKNIFNERGYLDYYEKYVEEPLKLITHDKSMNYDQYIDLAMLNPISSLAKMMDLCDNLMLTDRVYLDEERAKKSENYVKYFYLINSKYNFLERFNDYRKEHNKRFKNEETDTSKC